MLIKPEIDFRRWTGNGTEHDSVLITQTQATDGWGLNILANDAATNTKATTSRVYVAPTGNVGINDSTPSYKLDVNGTGRFIDTLKSDKFIQIAEASTTLTLKSDKFIQIAEASTTLDEGKGIGYLVTDVFANVGNDSITRYLNHYGWGIHKPLGASVSGGRGTYMSGYFGMDFYTSGVNRIHVAEGGQVGIGNTNDTYKLDVTGGATTCAEFNITGNGYPIRVDTSSGTAGSFSGIEFRANSTDWGRIRTTQDTGLGTMIFSVRKTSANSDRMQITGDGNVSIGGTGNTYKLDVSGTGRFTSTVEATNFILSSDERLKDNIEDFDYNSHINIDVKTYELKSEKGVKRTGVIAQELEVKHPEFVRTDDEGVKSVAYIDLLMAKVAELEARLEKLEK
jgi:hypothetical protein